MPSLFFFFFDIIGCPGQFARTSTNPTGSVHRTLGSFPTRRSSDLHCFYYTINHFWSSLFRHDRFKEAFSHSPPFVHVLNRIFKMYLLVHDRSIMWAVILFQDQSSKCVRCTKGHNSPRPLVNLYGDPFLA